MMIHFADLKSPQATDLLKAAPSFGIGFPGDPGSKRRAEKLVQYQVNVVWMRQHVLLSEDEEVDAE